MDPCVRCPHRDGMLCDPSCDLYQAYLCYEKRAAKIFLIYFAVMALAICAIPLTIAAWGAR
jgi:hypothetical protein